MFINAATTELSADTKSIESTTTIKIPPKRIRKNIDDEVTQGKIDDVLTHLLLIDTNRYNRQWLEEITV